MVSLSSTYKSAMVEWIVGLKLEVMVSSEHLSKSKMLKQSKATTYYKTLVRHLIVFTEGAAHEVGFQCILCILILRTCVMQ